MEWFCVESEWEGERLSLAWLQLKTQLQRRVGARDVNDECMSGPGEQSARKASILKDVQKRGVSTNPAFLRIIEESQKDASNRFEVTLFLPHLVRGIFGIPC